MIRSATEQDVPVILDLIKQLAEYERLSDKVIANEQSIRDTLFRERPAAEVLLAIWLTRRMRNRFATNLRKWT